MGDVQELTDGRPAGAHFGQSTTDLIAFFGVTPVVQPSSASQAAAAATTTTTATTTALQTDLDSLRVLVNQLRSELVTLGLIKGSA